MPCVVTLGDATVSHTPTPSMVTGAVALRINEPQLVV